MTKNENSGNEVEIEDVHGHSNCLLVVNSN